MLPCSDPGAGAGTRQGKEGSNVIVLNEVLNGLLQYAVIFVDVL